MPKISNSDSLNARIRDLEKENLRLKETISGINNPHSLPLRVAYDHLPEIQERFKKLVNLLPQTIWEANANGVFTYVNKYAEIEFGYTHDEIVGKLKMVDVIIPSERYLVKPVLTNPRIGIEITMLRKNGSTFPALVHYTPIVIDDELVCLQGITTNISEQKRIEIKLQESSLRNRAILDAIPDMMFVFDQNGIFIDFHASSKNLLLQPAKEFIGKNIEDVVPLPLSVLNKQMLELLFRLREPQVYSYPLTLNGTTHYFDARMVLQGDDKALCIVRDITEQKRIEEALRQSEENYHTIFQLANDAILILNSETGEVVDANRAAIQSYGYTTLSEMQEKGYWSESPYGLDDALEWNRRAMSEGPQIFEWKNFRIDGTIFWEEVNLSVLKILGTKRIISISRDITIRKSVETELQRINRELKIRNEEYAALNKDYAAQNDELQKSMLKAEESDRLKSAFLANMSHEIRTPMNAIIGFSSLLNNSDLTLEKQKYFSQIIRKRSADLLKIIDDILDISKIEVNQILLQPTKGSIRELLNEVFEYSLTKAEIDSKLDVHISLVNQAVDADEITTDFGRLKQVLFNLIENALKFTKQGTIEIGCKMKDSKELLFYVKDTGTGISKENQTKIFERFQQAHNAMDSSFGGTGLGLTISKGLIELLGGSIWVDSELDKGSCFCFTTPLLQSNGHKLSRGELTLTPRTPINAPILIVEDDELNANFIKEILLPTGAALWIASSGSRALEIASKNSHIKVILLDLRLPDYNGLNLIEPLKEILPGCKIIIQSAYATPEDKALGKQAGSDGYITKPIDFNQLIATILEAVKG